jgi:hypothetical protein
MVVSDFNAPSQTLKAKNKDPRMVMTSRGVVTAGAMPVDRARQAVRRRRRRARQHRGTSRYTDASTLRNLLRRKLGRA